MKMSKTFLAGIAFLFFVGANTEAAQTLDHYTPFSSLLMKGMVDIETNSRIREKTNISLHFTLGSNTNGIIPARENVTIGFRTAPIVGEREQCFVIYIPAYSFVRTNNWYEIYDPASPAEIGIKVLVVDEKTGEVIKDLTNTLKFFDSVITLVEKQSQYYLSIEAVFEHDNTHSTSLAFIGSSTKSVLILGDDSGSTFARSIEFKHP